MAYDVEYRIVKPDGEVRHVREVGEPVLDSGGLLIQTFGTIQDITEFKQAEEALRQSEERFRQVAENIHEMFWLTDPDKSEVLYVSQAYEEIYGRSAVSLYQTPQSWLDAIHPDDRDRVRVGRMVGDGISNIGRIATTARDEAVAAGITINGLVMAQGKAIRVLSRYYRREVIGGPTAFLQLSVSNQDFADAMLKKMVLEMVRLRAPNAQKGKKAG